MFTSVVNKSSLLKNEKKKRNLEVMMRRRWEGDVKTKTKWFRKQNRKEDEACDKENENKGELRGW